MATASIVGGTPTAPGAYPWMAALTLHPGDPLFKEAAVGGFFCGGTLIAPDRVLTAGHCVDGLSPLRFDVIIGDGDLTGPAPTRVQVTGFATYPGYKSVPGSKDVAILQLATPVDVPPLPLIDAAQAAQLAAGTPVRALGRGVTNPTAEQDDAGTILRETDLSLVADATCQQMYPHRFHPYTQLCAGSAPGRGVCYGDSGGPLLIQSDVGWMELGVASQVGKIGVCVANRFPALFSRLSTLGGFALSPAPTFAPYNLRRPTIRGRLKPGATLRCRPGRWHGQHRPFRFRWSRSDFFGFEPPALGSQHRRRLQVTPALARSGVRCEVQAENRGGFSTASSRGRKH